MSRFPALFATRRRWRVPRKSECVIFGSSGSEILLNYLRSDSQVFRHHDYELNIPVLVLSILKSRRGRIGYLKTYLELVQPRVVLTFEDNDPLFYQIAVWFPKIITIAIQNGRRDHFANEASQGFFERLTERSKDGLASVSHLCLFGPAVSSLYTSALTTSSASLKIWYIGSLKNNAVEGNKSIELRRRVVYISSLPTFSTPRNTTTSNEIAAYYGDQPVTYRSYWQIESTLPKILHSFAKEHGFELHVLGKRSGRIREEKQHFDRVLGAGGYYFHPAHDQAVSYQFPTSGDLIISSESTLAYEFFARGYRVGFIGARLHLAGLAHRKDCHFGFPLDIESSGPFWTSECTQAEVLRILNFINLCSEDAWIAASKQLRKQTMIFDEQNGLFCELLTEVGVRNSGPRFWQPELIPFN